MLQMSMQRRKTRAALCCTLTTLCIGIVALVVGTFWAEIDGFAVSHGVLVDGEYHFAWPANWTWIGVIEKNLGRTRLENGASVDGFTLLLTGAVLCVVLIIIYCTCHPGGDVMSPLRRAQTEASFMDRLLQPFSAFYAWMSPPTKRRPRASVQLRTTTTAAERIADSTLKSALERGLQFLGDFTSELVVNDDDMPQFLRARVLRFTQWFWSELQAEIMASVLLESSYAAQRTRAAEIITLERRTPRLRWCPNPLAKLRAIILYTVKPYDRGFWAQAKSPLFLLLSAFTVFPSYGVQPIAFFVFFLLLDRSDEYQLTSFILNFKGLQFISGGVMAGLLGGVRLQVCASMDTCDTFGANGAPGMYRGFFFESAAFCLNVVLVWLAFLLLPCTHQKGALGAALTSTEAEGLASTTTPQSNAWTPMRSRAPLRREHTLVRFLGPLAHDTKACCGKIGVSLSRGGSLRPLLKWDLFAFLLSAAMMATALQHHDGWKRRAWIFWGRVLYGVASLPFLPFAVPPFDRILLHSKPTGYNKRGRTVPVLSMRDRQLVRRLKLERQSFETLATQDHVSALI